MAGPNTHREALIAEALGDQGVAFQQVFHPAQIRMNIHKNAALTPKSRGDVALGIAQGQSKAEVAGAFGICAKTAAQWFTRLHSGGETALNERSSRPKKLRVPTPETLIKQAIALRSSPIAGKEVARRLGLSAATVRRILRRVRLSRVKDLVPPLPAKRKAMALCLALVGQYLREGDTRGIINADMTELPACAAPVGLAGTIAGDAVSNAYKSPEFPDIDVDHVAGMFVCVASDRFGWFDIPER